MSDKQLAPSLYEQMKQDIREHKLPVGVALKQEELSLQYGVSRIPIRDVLQKLKNEGWLSAHGKRGVMVQPLTVLEAEDLSLMRQLLEPLLLGFAMPNLNKQTLGIAADILTELDKNDLSVAQYGELNWQFHACLYRAAQRPTLFNNIENLQQLCSRYIGYHAVELKYNNTSQNEHHQLLAAITANNTELAQTILKQHIAKASSELVDYLHAVAKA